MVQLKCQNLRCNNDLDQNDQNHSDHKDQDKYGKANTLSPFSIFYTEKLTSLKRRKFFLRAVVIKPAGRYISLMVLLNGRAYVRRTGYVFRPCLPKRIVYCKGTQTLLVRTYRSSWEVLPFFKLQKGSIFDPFASGVLLRLEHLSSFFT